MSLAVTAAAQTSSSPTLKPDQTLKPEEAIHSSNGNFSLKYQGDGNLVLSDTAGKVYWNSETNGTAPGYVTMQRDGNVVIFDSAGQPKWSSGTAGFEGASLALQDDGNLVVSTASKFAPWDAWTDNLRRHRIAPPPGYRWVCRNVLEKGADDKDHVVTECGWRKSE